MSSWASLHAAKPPTHRAGRVRGPRTARYPTPTRWGRRCLRTSAPSALVPHSALSACMRAIALVLRLALAARAVVALAVQHLELRALIHWGDGRERDLSTFISYDGRTHDDDATVCAMRLGTSARRFCAQHRVVRLALLPGYDRLDVLRTSSAGASAAASAATTPARAGGAPEEPSAAARALRRAASPPAAEGYSDAAPSSTSIASCTRPAAACASATVSQMPRMRAAAGRGSMRQTQCAVH